MLRAAGEDDDVAHVMFETLRVVTIITVIVENNYTIVAARPRRHRRGSCCNITQHIITIPTVPSWISARGFRPPVHP